MFMLDKLFGSVNKIGFLLQFGYFKATGRFFEIDNFATAEIEYVEQLLAISDPNLTLQSYNARTQRDHRTRIAQFFHCIPFDEKQKEILKTQIKQYVEKCIRPKKILFSLAQQYCYEKKILPHFNTVCQLITQSYNSVETNCLFNVKANLTQEQQITLDELMPLDKKNNKSPFQRAKLVFLKHLNQSTRPAKINETITNFAVVKILYRPLKSVIEKLGLTPQAIEYYAGWVYKARAAQVKQFPVAMKRYLHLICFIFHQYCQYQDTLIDVYLKSVQSMLGGIERKKRKRIIYHVKNVTKRLKLWLMIETSLVEPCEKLKKQDFLPP